MDKYLHQAFGALGDATRLAVVEQLLQGPATVSELAAPHSMALPAFIKHLGVLERAGIVVSAKQGRVRTCKINPSSIDALDRWFEDRRKMWRGRFAKLDRHFGRNRKGRVKS